MAYNRMKKQEYQPGGVAMVVLNRIAHQVTQPGEDKLGSEDWDEQN